MKTQAEHPTEVEAKFTVADPTLLRELAKQKPTLSGYRFGPPTTSELRDVFLDTPDYCLLRHGYYLRIRSEDGWQRTTDGAALE